MGIFRSSVVALSVLVGGLVPAVPAAADDGIGPGAYRPYYPGIWQGLYAGVNGGWGWSGDASGYVVGGQVGYNWQSNKYVYGLEADISKTDIGISESVGGFGAIVTASASIDWITTIRGRFGILTQPGLLIYGTAGLAIVNASAHASINVLSCTPGLPCVNMGSSVHESTTGTGLVFGVGVEKQISETMTARLEYLEFGQTDRIGDFGIVRAGLTFKFGQ
jgi:outer membrane immunogenic protein